MSIIPDWAYWIAIGVLTAAVGAQQVRVANAHTALSKEQKARSDETIQRQNLVIAHADKLRGLESKHAEDQQKKEESYAAQILVVKNAGAVDRADAVRLRRQLSDYTSSATRPGETDAVACQRAQDRLPRVGALLAEGVGLEAESRELIRQRDAEVELLLGQIKIDRAACSPDSK